MEFLRSATAAKETVLGRSPKTVNRKSEAELRVMREACAIAATVLEELSALVAPGVNTYDIDQEGKTRIAGYGATSACYNYRGSSRVAPFPAYTCLSVNEEIVHGIGSLQTVLRPGDILSLDVSVVYEGFIGDNARTVMLPPVREEVRTLVEETRNALGKAIAQARPNKRVGDISHAVQTHVEKHRLSVVRDFVGHGVGRTMHEEPQIPNYGPPGRGPRLHPGMTLAIEPMINLGRPEIEMGADGWTALTRDRSPSAHFEQTVLVTESDPEILTVSKK